MSCLSAHTNDSPRTVTFGLALGRGTGPQLGGIWADTLMRVGALYGVRPRVVQAGRLFASAEPRDATTCGEDADAYCAFVARAHAAGARALFRTSIGARALYMARQRLAAVKVDRFATTYCDM